MQKNKRGFTLIELMMVVAVIAILASVVLISLNSAREKASLNKYTAYAAQMYRLVGDSVAAGYFDQGVIAQSGTTVSQLEGGSYCLGSYNSCGSGHSAISATAGGAPGAVYNALTNLTDMPEEVEYSPYNAAQGVTLDFDYSTRGTARINMYLLNSDQVYLTKVCDSLNWTADSGGYCYIDVPLSARL